VTFQKLFAGQGTKLYPDDPVEFGLVLQRKYEVVIFLLHDTMLVQYVLLSCVCPSICLSHATIVSKQLNIGSCKQCHTINKRL